VYDKDGYAQSAKLVLYPRHEEGGETAWVLFVLGTSHVHLQRVDCGQTFCQGGYDPKALEGTDG
jgi:hypothetical protein